ncbi:hypothetical protein [Eubacterium callanderi]|jgi:hypothetical protein|nr:hypothetical protein [Eubacterium callanderi]
MPFEGSSQDKAKVRLADNSIGRGSEDALSVAARANYVIVS